jgi:hypothetical protein
MSLMERFEIDGVFYLMGTAAFLLALLAGGRSLISASPMHLERPFEILAPQAALLAHDQFHSSDELSPRTQSTHLPLTASVEAPDESIRRGAPRA